MILKVKIYWGKINKFADPEIVYVTCEFLNRDVVVHFCSKVIRESTMFQLNLS